MKSVLIAFLVACAPVLADTATVSARPAKWARPVSASSLGNFFQIDSLVYRSSQPSLSDTAAIRRAGIRTIVNLREYHSDDKGFQKSGLTLLRHEMNAGNVGDSDLVTVLRMVDTAPKPVLVHCWHGSDRTGFVIAGYRVLVQGWSRAEAVKELREGGYGYHAKTYPNVAKAVERLDSAGLVGRVHFR